MVFTAHRRLWLICALLVMTGCTRTHNRIRADRETYGILREKTVHTPWMPPFGFTIFPDPESRFFDPTPTDDPQLPLPSPKLYAYNLPEIPKRDPARFRSQKATNSEQPHDEDTYHLPETLPPPSECPCNPSLPKAPISSKEKYVINKAEKIHADGGIRRVSWQENNLTIKAICSEDQEELRIQPVPKKIWESVPNKCLRRMFEFESIREEYVRSFEKEPGRDQRDQSQRLALEDIVKLGTINSRAYQTQKENLYRVALALTFERYQFRCKFTPFGNGTIVDYIHNRTNGSTVNTLDIPSRFNGDQILATGGTLLSRFANNVLLTFNGPEGFAADINSELLFEVTQSVFQRDIVFEALTQNERDVVYAARDFARFRKIFFRNLAFQYYQLLNTYRDIEISAQNYFGNLRAYLQYEAEFSAGKQGRNRVELDQLEQGFISSRSQLIQDCNDLEDGLDDLKFAIGIPPELPLNLDLAELRDLTRRDETTVTKDLVRRTRRKLKQQRDKKEPDQIALINDAIELTRRILRWIELRKGLGEKDIGRQGFEIKLNLLLADEAELEVDFDRRILASRIRDKSPAVLIFERTKALNDSLKLFICRLLQLARTGKAEGTGIKAVRQKLILLNERRRELAVEFDDVLKKRQLNRIPKLVIRAESLRKDLENLAKETSNLVSRPELTLQKTLADVDALLSQSSRVVAQDDSGLAPIEISMDDAMLTALTQRFDLMNFRGFQADEWRRIKLAADDLKSILNLRATQIIGTEKDRPFGFTFDESQTELVLEFDAPLNRKAQRNAFRNSLINYQVALRAVINLEDSIKIDVRDDLRALELNREQYRIAISNAALAFERVQSTSKQLQLGKLDVSARDFLEAQQAYTSSLSNVASEHIDLIQNRISLFLNLELLTVNENGFWPELYNESYQPTPYYTLPPVPPYGTLPHHIWYSHKIKRMLRIPPGETLNFNPEFNEQPSEDKQTEDKRPEKLPPPKEINPNNEPNPERIENLRLSPVQSSSPPNVIFGKPYSPKE